MITSQEVVQTQESKTNPRKDVCLMFSRRQKRNFAVNYYCQHAAKTTKKTSAGSCLRLGVGKALPRTTDGRMEAPDRSVLDTVQCDIFV